MIDSDEKIIFKNEFTRWSYNKVSADEIATLATESNLPLPIAEILYKRGIKDKLSINIFLTSPLDCLLDPFGISDMDKATKRIYRSIIDKELICIYGDYDVDGITSTSLMYLFLKEVGANVRYYIPNRLEEGYGLNISAIEEIASSGTKLIITVDCGISANIEVAKAKELGVDLIITDHHEPSEELPPDAYAIINPIISTDNYSFKNLSGVGVAFKLITALRTTLRKNNYFFSSIPNIKKYLDIVTLGTIADVVPIIKENRIFVKHGLAMMHSRCDRLGIKELIKISGVTAPALKVSHVGYSLAPRLNAVGRMGSSDKSIRLLITDNINEAKQLATDLESENKYRQNIEREILQESFAMIEKDHLDGKSIVLMRDNWHPGVIGIVASRVVDKYFRPTIILSADGDIAKGSARSIPAFHLYDGLSSLQEIMLSFGGHKYAAGLKIYKADYDKLSKEFDKLVSDKLTDDDMIPETTIDVILNPKDITFDLADFLIRLEPFGSGNKEPVFCLSGLTLQPNYAFVGKEFKHLKAQFKHGDTLLNSIGFNMDRFKSILSSNNLYDIIFNLTINEYNGNRNLQLNLKDIRLSL